MTIQNGKEVAFDYTLTVDGETVDTSKGRGPLEYKHGDGKLIPGLTKRMEGMELGEERKIEVPAAEGYGEVNPDAIKEVPRSQINSEGDLQPGMVLQVQRVDGTVMPVKITEVKDDTVVVDFNHPLAGKTLHFDIKVTAIK